MQYGNSEGDSRKKEKVNGRQTIAKTANHLCSFAPWREKNLIRSPYCITHGF